MLRLAIGRSKDERLAFFASTSVPSAAGQSTPNAQAAWVVRGKPPLLLRDSLNALLPRLRVVAKSAGRNSTRFRAQSLDWVRRRTQGLIHAILQASHPHRALDVLDSILGGWRTFLGGHGHPPRSE